MQVIIYGAAKRSLSDANWQAKPAPPWCDCRAPPARSAETDTYIKFIDYNVRSLLAAREKGLNIVPNDRSVHNDRGELAMARRLPRWSVFVRATLGYDGRRGSCRAVDSDIRAGDLIAIAGPNGSGKTTIFRTILGFLPVLSGSLARNCALSEFGYVPQSSALDSTFPITAREVVAMGGYGRLKPYQGLPAERKTALGRCACSRSG